MFVVRVNFVGKKKAHKVKTGYEAGTGIFRLLSKASNTVLSRGI